MKTEHLMSVGDGRDVITAADWYIKAFQRIQPKSLSLNHARNYRLKASMHASTTRS